MAGIRIGNPVAEAGIRLLLGYKKFLFLLMLSWVPFFVQAFTLYLILVKGTNMGFSVEAGFFQNAFWVQMFPLVLVTIYAGSGLIVSDLAANALRNGLVPVVLDNAAAASGFLLERRRRSAARKIVTTGRARRPWSQLPQPECVNRLDESQLRSFS